MPSKSLRAVVFDRDGVLTYFDWPAVAAFLRPRLPVPLEDLTHRWQRWGEAIGFPRNAKEEAIFWHGFWEQIASDLAVPPAVRSELHAFSYTSVVRPYSDARPALLRARENGLRIGVLSNFSLASLDASLAAAGLADLVDLACAATVIGVAKPDPAAYLAVLQELGVTAEEAILLDDELDCVEGGRALGMQAYLVDRHGRQQALGQGVVHDLCEAAKLFE